MKKIASYIIIGSMAFSAVSCSDGWLDVEPSTAVETDKSINELSDVDIMLNGIYNTMQNAYAYSGRLVYYGDACGDDMMAYSSTKRTGNYYTFNFTKDTAPSSFWSYPYEMISLCNIILSKIDDVETKEEELRDYYKGQALALRAMFLFDLTKFYGYPYKKDNGASLGVPIVLSVLDKEAKPKRNTVAECYKQVIDDLKAAITAMDNDEGKSFHKGHINLFAAQTLLSRVYLYHGDDSDALDMATQAIKGAEAEGYKLWTNAEYATAWGNDASNGTKGEVLFEIVNTTDDSPGKESLGRLHSPSGYKDICLTSSFYALLNEDPDDVRLKLLEYSSKRAFVKKYQPQDGEDIMDANIPLIRLSEAYLNAAEAAVKTGDNPSAVKYLNAIVSRANPANSVEGSTVTLDRVMTERRKELVGEGHRFFDALRDGGSVDRHDVKGQSKISSTKHYITKAEKMNFSWDYYKCVLAIPKAEMDANSNMLQNPLYDSSKDDE
mgnify:FL=1